MLRRKSIAFALVDLVVTLVLVVTLSGLASLYYTDSKKQMMEGIVQNELDELAKAVVAWELQHRRPVTIKDVEDAMKRRSTPLMQDRRYGNLDFLVEEGRLPTTPLDPWKNDYLIDPGQGLVFTVGKDKDRVVEPRPGSTRSYRRESKDGTKGFEVDLKACRVPPVIAELAPCATVLKTGRPLIRGLYYAAPGCAIDLTRTQLYIDGQVIENATKSSGQVAYTPSANLTEEEHTAVLVVTDTAGNQARKQCTFVVHTAQPDIRITKPASGAAVRCAFPIEGIVFDKGISHWVVNWDFRQIARGEREIGETASDGSITPGALVAKFDTRDPNQPVDDGRHFVTLIEKDRSGLTFTAQTEVVVDNNSPIVQIASKQPTKATLSTNNPARGSENNPYVYTTDIVRISGTARDNLMVRDVRFKFTDRTTGQELANQPTAGTTAVPVKWDPKDITTTRNWGALYNAPIVDWSTLPSKGTTKQQVDAGFLFTKIPPGLYKFEVWAKDLATNDSRNKVACDPAAATTSTAMFFNVNLFKGGIAGGIVVDKIAVQRGSPFFIYDRTISGAAGSQTSATVIFTPLESTKSPRTTQWEIVIDDNGGNLENSGDNMFITTRGHAKEDFWATGELLATTGEIRMHSAAKRATGVAEGSPPGPNNAWYIPDLAAHQIRRAAGVTRNNTATTQEPIVQGVYKARITYQNDLGESRSMVTTFVVDKQRPVDGGPVQLTLVDEKTIEYREFNFTEFFPCTEPHLQQLSNGKPRVITGFSQPAQKTGTIEFFGTAKDFPPEGVIQRVSWSLQQTDTSSPTAPIKILRPLEQVYPRLTSQNAMNVVSYGYLGKPPNGPTMSSPETTELGKFDGRGYSVSVSLEDGAGLTTTVTRLFTFNSVGPLIRQFTIENARGGPQKIEPNAGDLPTLHTVDGQTLVISFGAVDETKIQNLAYRIFPAGGGSALPVRIPDNPLDEGIEVIQNFQITRDENNREFLSLPTTYQLQVFGSNEFGQDGVVFATNIGFRFLTNVAIYAPHYTAAPSAISTFRTIAQTNASWIGFDEQRQIADFLFENVKSAGVKKIFNFTGFTAQSTIDADPESIQEWVRTATSNKTTDVLVILDAFPARIWDNTPDADVVRFLESRSTDAAKTLANKDGDSIVWVGEVPFAWVYDDFGRRRKAPGANDRNTGHRTAFKVGTSSLEVFYEIANAEAATPLADRYQEVTPFGNGSLFLPHLPPYDPYEDLRQFSGSTLDTDRQLKNTLRQPQQLTGTAWFLEKLFSVDRGQLADVANGTSQVKGGNFVFKNRDSLGTIAHFISAGPKVTVQTTLDNPVPGIRRPVPIVGPVVKDYIDRYLLNAIQPTDASKRIYFGAKSSTVFGGLGGTPRDVVYWPSKSEGFINITTNSSADQDAQLMGASNNRGALYTAKTQTQFNSTFAFSQDSLFLFPPGPTLLLQGVNTLPIPDASLGANGTAFAFSTQADRLSATPLLAPAVFFRRVSGVDPLTVTNGNSPSSFPALDPDVSANGDFVVFRSRTIYNPSNAPPSFPTMSSTLEPRIYRFSTARTNNDVYADGEVSGSRLDDTSTSTLASHTRPAVSRDGRFVAWQVKNARFAAAALTNPTTQIVLAYSRVPGSANPWIIGAITSDPVGESIHLDMTPETVDTSYPYITFESIVDYDNSFPHLVAGAGQDVGVNDLDDSEGARSSASPKLLLNRAIYLFAGSFGRPLLRVASSPDAQVPDPGRPGGFISDCINPKISADGEEIVFESKAQVVEGFYVNDGTTIVRQRITNTVAGINRVYRVRVRPVETGRVPPGAILHRITPEPADLGPRSAPHVTN